MRNLTRGEVEALANGMIARVIEVDEDAIGNALADSGDWADHGLPQLYNWLEAALDDCRIDRPAPA